MNTLKKFKNIQTERLRAFHEFPYFSSILSKLHFYECDSIETLAIDQYGRVYVNVTFWESLTLLERVGLLIHEMNHLLRRHFKRGESLGLDPKTLNIIGDIEINDSVKMRKFLPEGAIYPEMFGFPCGLTFEEYAALWKKNAQKEPEKQPEPGDQTASGSGGDGTPGESKEPGKQPGVASGNCGSAADGEKKDYELPEPKDGGPGIDETDLEIVGRQVAQAVREAAKTRGDVPGSLVEWATGVLSPPVIDWRSKLRSLARNAAAWVKGQGDYSYSKLSKYSHGGKVIIPGGVSPVPEISLMIDTSGSMSSADLQRILPEAQSCLRTSAGSAGKVCIVDARVHSLKPVTDVRKIQFSGRGGTDLRVGFEAISKLRPRPDILVVFTDGYTPWPKCSPRGMKTIVALVGRHCSVGSVPKWAKTIVIPQSN